LISDLGAATVLFSALGVAVCASCGTELRSAERCAARRLVFAYEFEVEYFVLLGYGEASCDGSLTARLERR
jgi:hypothetical protein